MKRSFFLLACILLSGCAAKFETAKFDTATWEPVGNKVTGIVYYEPQLVRIRYEFTAIVDKDGNVKGTAEKGTCVQTIQKEEITVQPNYSDPRVLIYDPYWFTSGKFSVSFSNGMLTAINAESTSQLADILGSAAKLKEAGFAAAAKPGVRPACNAAPVVTSIQKQSIPWQN